MSRRLLQAGAALLISSLLGLGMVIPASAESSQSDVVSPAIPQLVSVPSQTPLTTSTRVPSFESGLSDPQQLLDGSVALPGVDAGSVLVRVSVFAPDHETVVTAAGAEVLHVSAGSDASTTVLLPIQDGRVPVKVDNQAPTRLEVLAAFGSDPLVPGTTTAVSQAVTRLDTTQGLGLQSVTPAAQDVSVVGLGGIPAEGVRAVYLTGTFTLSAPGTVTVAGQLLDLPAGTSIVTTVVPVSATGNIALAGTAVSSAHLSVSGWVTGSAQDLTAANVTGSFVPAPQQSWSAANAGETFTLSGSTDRSVALALVTAQGSAERGFLELGSASNGRSRGIVVDGTSGAAPQLEVVEGTGSVPVVARGDVGQVNVLLVGDFVGAQSVSAPLEVTIDALPEGVADLTEVGAFTLSGTVTSEQTVDHVAVYADGSHIGNAAVYYGSEGITWQLQVSAPTAGSHQIEVRATGRSGTEASTSLSITTIMPNDEETVITEETVVVDTETLVGLVGETLIFSVDPLLVPGDVVVAGVSDATPEGAILRVLAVEAIDGQWHVLTEQAAITDVFMQVSFRAEGDALAGDAQIEHSTEVPEGTEVVDHGVENVWFTELEAAPQQRMAPFAFAAPRASVTASKEIGIGVNLALNRDGTARDLSRARHADRTTSKNQIQASGGVAIDAEFKLTIAFVMELDVRVGWAWVVPVPEVTHFKTGFEGDIGGEITVSISAEIVREYKAKIADVKLPVSTFMAGPVPITLHPEAGLDYTSTIGAEATLSYSESWGSGWKRGVVFEKGSGWDTYNEPSERSTDGENSCGAWADNVSLEGEITGKAGLELSTGMKVYGIAGPVLALEVGVEASYKVTATPSDLKADYKLSLFVAGSGKVEVKFEVFGVEIGGLEATLVRIERRIALNTQYGIPLPFCSAVDPGDGEPGDGETDPGDSPEHGLLSGTVTNAQTNQRLAGVEVRLRDSANQVVRTTSDANGNYSFDVPAGTYHLQVNHSGYIAYSVRIEIAEHGTHSQNIGISEVMSGTEYRAVLTWGAAPSDLDSHLLGSNSWGTYHVAYYQKSVWNLTNTRKVAELDVDDTSSYGPETTTFEVDEDGRYLFFVHNFSGNYESTLAESGAQVVVYRGSERLASFNVSGGSNQSRYWTVFRIENGEVIPINQLGEMPEDVWGNGVSRAMNLSSTPAASNIFSYEALQRVAQEVNNKVK